MFHCSLALFGRGVELFKHSLRLVGGSSILNIKFEFYIRQVGRVV